MSPVEPLPSQTPSDAGVDATGILNLIDALEDDPAQEPHGLMILRRGSVIAQGWWAPYTASRPELMYSLSKSFTSAAAGVLVDDGVLDLDSPVVAHFPEFADEIADERTRRMLVRHVASMASGHENEMIDAAYRTDAAEPVRGFLLHPPEREPGTVFAYNQPATYTLAAIVQRLAGRTLVDLLRERVLGPIGAGPIAWDEGPAGRNVGFSGGYATTDTIARLGLLLLQRGLWEGRRVLSEQWVEDATSVHIATAAPGDAETSDWARGYGFQHWRSRHGYRGDGAFGQLCLVIPEHDMVVAYQGQSGDMQRLLDAVWRHLLPAAGRAGSAAADAALAERLAAATLPEPHVERVAADPEAWEGLVFASPAGDDADADAEGATVASARVRRDGDGWVLTLTGSTGDVEVPFTGEPGWTVTAAEGPAVAAAGGFGGEELVLDVAFVETPHRLHLRLDRAAGVVAAQWETPPLRDVCDLRGLAAPRRFG